MYIYAKQKEKWIFIQNHQFTFINIRSVKKVTITQNIELFAYRKFYWYLWNAKPLVSGPKTLGFTLWNPWFYNVKPMLSDCNLMGFSTRKQNCIFMQKMRLGSGQDINHKKQQKNNRDNLYMPYCLSIKNVVSVVLLLLYIVSFSVSKKQSLVF